MFSVSVTSQALRSYFASVFLFVCDFYFFLCVFFVGESFLVHALLFLNRMYATLCLDVYIRPALFPSFPLFFSSSFLFCLLGDFRVRASGVAGTGWRMGYAVRGRIVSVGAAWAAHPSIEPATNHPCGCVRPISAPSLHPLYLLFTPMRPSLHPRLLV